MAKVFTITEGLENMGALKTGGQGSVYKARRKDGTITAVKLLPTPIFSESLEDKNYRDFQNEVEKLRKVNETPNPHVVTILNAGITETGNFPFIEMEFIEGPDLEELLKPPHAPVFSIHEAIKVARHISNAIAHCHRVGVKHGDIKTNNVKLNSKTDNYVLLDFGLAVMSDEQRRTSLRHAGAIEFMAPEQNEGKMLFPTDVYSFGIILFELLAGQVPFPLKNKGETARNNVMVSHMETPPPDLVQLRKEHLPQSWSDERKRIEMVIPAWLLEMIDKCLQKNPNKRFANGMELFGFIHLNSTETKLVDEVPPITVQETSESEPEIIPSYKEPETIAATNFVEEAQLERKRSGAAPLLLILPILFLLGFGAYYVLGKKSGNHFEQNSTMSIAPDTTTNEAGAANPVAELPKEKPSKANTTDTTTQQTAFDTSSQIVPIPIPIHRDTTVQRDTSNNNSGNENAQPKTKTTSLGKYKVRSKAYLYTEPDETTRRNAFMTQWDGAFSILDETDDFVYVIFTNTEGQTSKGWLRKQDLLKVD